MTLKVNQSHPDQECKVLRPILIEGKTKKKGTKVTLSYQDARLLETAGKVQILDEKPKKPSAPDPDNEKDKEEDK